MFSPSEMKLTVEPDADARDQRSDGTTTDTPRVRAST